MTIGVLLTKLDILCGISSRVLEESYRLTVSGDCIDQGLVTLCSEIAQLSAALGLPCPTFKVDSNFVGVDEMVEFLRATKSEWCIVVSKKPIADLLAQRSDNVSSEANVVFLSEARALDWVNKIDPFAEVNSQLEPDFKTNTTIWVHKLSEASGGDVISIIPADGNFVRGLDRTIATLPETTEVSELVHINSDEYLQIKPKTFILTWGACHTDIALAFSLIAIRNLVASICYELKKENGQYYACFKGTKKLTVNLSEKALVDILKLHDELIKTVSWVYRERAETRLQLVMDRLSLDIISTNDFYSELTENISTALQQSQDSYAFVILDRKDAYHKEIRELLKDMRSQADMYASKVRDLVSNITRDVLGILAFVGYSFLGKFDNKNIDQLLASHELSLLVKFLSGYLILSCVLQVIIHSRDAFLTLNESEKWLKVLQRYTSREENQESFLLPIRKRRRTLFISLGVMVSIYIVLALTMWFLPTIVTWLLS
ncbi:TPA: hypothetical protein PXP22_002119 [Yersinia enterocolitica]|nr:hypothetical protein [Yersinia enterocolitica]HDL7789088.1 hypothetical protein [Yersinia enterocolitica]HDL8193851.1 hypothetical protein [Yersinia enterocolitica]